MTRQALTLEAVAERLGVTRRAVRSYKIPPPDVTLGRIRGWWPETIDAWNAARPGQGARTDLRK